MQQGLWPAIQILFLSAAETWWWNRACTPSYMDWVEERICLGGVIGTDLIPRIVPRWGTTDPVHGDLAPVVVVVISFFLSGH